MHLRFDGRKSINCVKLETAIPIYCQADEINFNSPQWLINWDWDNDEITVCWLTLASQHNILFYLSITVCSRAYFFFAVHLSRHTRISSDTSKKYIFFCVTRFHSAHSTAQIVVNVPLWQEQLWMQTHLFNVWKRHSMFCAQLTFCVQQIAKFVCISISHRFQANSLVNLWLI